MTKIRLSLWQQIFLLLGLMGFVIGGLAVYGSNLYERHYGEIQLTKQNQRVLSFLSAGSVDAIISEDSPVLATLVDQVMVTDPEILRIRILNERGRVLMEKNTQTTGVPRETIKFDQLITLEGENFGTIELYWDIRLFSNEVFQQTRHTMALVAFVVLVMTLSFFLTIKHVFVTPISKINRKLLQLSSNSKNTPLVFCNNTAIEIQNLAESVNSLQQSQTHREQILADLAIAKERAESSNEAKNKFLAVMSHEIRTPINGIMGMAEMLREENLKKGQRKYLDVILQSSKNLLEIVNDILDFSRIEKDKLKLLAKPFALSELLGQLREEFSPLADRKNIGFHLSEDEKSTVILIADRGLLRQVLTNLLSNAFKFTEEGRISLKVETKMIDEAQVELSVEVKDTGIGIVPKEQDRIFEEFKQLDDGFSRRYMGLGLGLALSQRIVRKMGGEISVESHPGKGSLFSFSLRLEKQSALRKPAVCPPENVISFPGEAGAAQQKKCVLLVEDSQTNRQVVEAMLEGSRFELEIAENGKQALEYVMHNNHRELHAILMDISTPEMDGMTATRKIRSLDGEIAQIPIIALTAHAHKDERDLFIVSGMDDYLAKPVGKNQLLATLSRWIP